MSTAANDSHDEINVQVFSDASGAGNDQFHSIAMVSGTRQACQALRQAVANCFSVEWKQVNGDSKAQEAALKYVEAAVCGAAGGTIRIDVITWNRHDRRHQIRGRDDEENRARMYYHALVHVGRQYGSGSYDLFPDEGECFCWDTLVECLERTNLAKRRGQQGASRRPLFEITQPAMTVALQQCASHQEPLVRLADVFAGMARWSREKAPRTVSWVERISNQAQATLLEMDDEDSHQRQSRSDAARTELVARLDRLSKRDKLGVSLREKGHLWTPDPRKPINFWPYEPQHDDDTAPTRGAVRK